MFRKFESEPTNMHSSYTRTEFLRSYCEYCSIMQIICAIWKSGILKIISILFGKLKEMYCIHF